MRFGGHQSFHLRDQWLYKGLHEVNKSPQLLLKPEKAMEELGVGKNMVSSIKYWLRAGKLIEDTSKGYALTETARIILEKDPYFELDGTLFLIHYLLVTNSDEATTWHWFFNHFSAREFDKEALTNAFYSYIQIKTDKKVNEKTLEKDLNCLLKMYQATEYTGRKNPETENPSPFTRYGWIEKKGERFIRNRLSVSDFNIHIFAHILYLFWKNSLGQPESVNLEDLSVKENSIGHVFDFSLEEMAEIIDNSSKNTKYFNYSRTGGYFIIRPNEPQLKKALNNYYKETAV